MDYRGNLDIRSPQAQREAAQRKSLSEALEQLAPDDFTQRALQALWVVANPNPAVSRAERSQASNVLKREVRAVRLRS